jgi:HSP20 family protein
VPSDFNQDATELADEARRLLLELDRDVPGAATLTAECRPPIDVYETPESLEVVIDVPGVPPEFLRVAVRRSTLVVVGAKLTPRTEGDARYHLAERNYGRFARAIRLAGAIDAAGAKASAGGGELRVTLPRVDDRRGLVHHIPVERI